MEPLTSDQIEARLDILWNVDEQACHRCGRAYPNGVAEDPNWWVDPYLDRAEDGEIIECATILCPECW